MSQLINQINSTGIYVLSALAGVYIINQFYAGQKRLQVNKSASQATEADVLIGNQPPNQFGGFMQQPRIPGPSAMEAVEERGFDSRGPAPRGFALNPGTRTKKGRRA